MFVFTADTMQQLSYTLSQVIDAISKSIEKTEGCSLLFVDSGKSSNRTVYTFVGDSADVVNGALNAAKCAYQLIDMKEHKGGSGHFFSNIKRC